MQAKQYGVDLPIDQVKRSPFHLRKESAQEKLEDLAASIKEVGLIHAVSVVRDSRGKRFELINGHRRFMAHRKAGLKTIRANIYEYDPKELKDESLRREHVRQFLFAANNAEPLVPIEKARAYRDFMDTMGWDPTKIAATMHVSEEEVIEDLQLLNLTQEVLDLVEAHPESFTTDSLRVLGRYASASASKAWVMSAEEQLRVAREIATQSDKKIVASSKALESRIKELVKERRNSAKKARRTIGRGGSDPVKGLFKLLDAVKKSVDDLTGADLSAIKEIQPADKGKTTEQLYALSERLVEFAEGRLAKLKAKRPARVA